MAKNGTDAKAALEGALGGQLGGVATNPGGMPQTMRFNQPDNGGLIASQLAQGGLLGAVGNPSAIYKPMNVPILQNPGQLQQWMQSQGMSYVDGKGKTVDPPKVPEKTGGTGGSTGGKTDPTKLYKPPGTH